MLKSYGEHHIKQLKTITNFLWGKARTEVIQMAAIQRYVASVNDKLLGHAHTLPLRFQVPTKIVHVFVMEYSESLDRCQAKSCLRLKRVGHLASRAARTES